MNDKQKCEHIADYMNNRPTHCSKCGVDLNYGPDSEDNMDRVKKALTNTSTPAQDVSGAIIEGLDRLYAQDGDKREDGRILRACSRCGKEFCKMGKVLEWGKHYSSFIVKRIDGKKLEYPEDYEVKVAVCRECAKELFDEGFIRSIESRAIERTLAEAREVVENHSHYDSGYDADDTDHRKGYQKACDDIARALAKKK